MLAFLLGVPGKLTALMADYTTARAAKIDNLDAAVTTRAAASTAVSNVDYTAARAAKLDAIIQTTVIQNVQSGVINGAVGTAGGSYASGCYRDVAISAVVTGKSVVLIWSGNSAMSYSGQLTSTTNLRIENTVAGSQFFVSWQVVEFK